LLKEICFDGHEAARTLTEISFLSALIELMVCVGVDLNNLGAPSAIG